MPKRFTKSWKMKSYPFITSSERNIPGEWVRVMKNTIKNGAAKFSARRMVKEYIEKSIPRVFKKY